MLGERIFYGYHHGTEGRTYFAVKQRLVWRFYLRFFKTDLRPCGNCQRKIQDEFIRIFKGSGPIEDGNFFVSMRWQSLCVACKREFEGMLKDREVILGNKDYTPLLELTRNWVNVEETYKELTRDEYLVLTQVK
jgi:hypothetical protein